LIPTTLLAQVDSCIGAKTSVNLPRAKNLLGTFCPPKRVLLTPHVLSTLATGDIQSGLSEALKLAMIDGAESVEWMEARLPEALRLRGLEEFIHKTLKIKQRFIEEDELDKGVRNLLNYGHTFGHAIEQITSYSIPHGVAVGMGIEMASFFSERLQFISREENDGVRRVMKPLTQEFWPKLGTLAIGEFMNIMKSDKKNTSAEITFILTKGFGKMVKHSLPVERASQLLGDFFACGNLK
jgi:3-dehydroquinate synthase